MACEETARVVTNGSQIAVCNSGSFIIAGQHFLIKRGPKNHSYVLFLRWWCMGTTSYFLLVTYKSLQIDVWITFDGFVKPSILHVSQTHRSSDCVISILIWKKYKWLNIQYFEALLGHRDMQCLTLHSIFGFVPFLFLFLERPYLLTAN